MRSQHHHALPTTDCPVARSRCPQSLVRVLAPLILLLFAAPAFAQVDVVAKYRVAYQAPLSADQKVALLRSVATEIHGGLLRKPDGTNCGGYSCDVICFSDVTLFDVLQDQDNAAIPTWNPTTNPRGYRCELVATNSPGQSSGATNPPAPVVPPSNPNIPSLDLTSILARLDAIYQQNERIYADSNNRRDAQTAELKAAIDHPGFLMTILGNRYVQLVLATVATYYTTHQVMK